MTAMVSDIIGSEISRHVAFGQCKLDRTHLLSFSLSKACGIHCLFLFAAAIQSMAEVGGSTRLLAAALSTADPESATRASYHRGTSTCQSAHTIFWVFEIPSLKIQEDGLLGRIQ